MKNANKHKRSARTTKHKLGLLAAPAAIVILAGFISIGVSERFGQEQVGKFQAAATDALQKATTKLDNYNNLLYTGRSFILSSQAVSQQEWKTFYGQQSAFSRYPGVSSIAYVSNVTTQDLSAFEAKMSTNEYFGPSYKLNNVSERPSHAFVSAYTSDNDISAVLGRDLTRLDDRNEVYRTAEAKGTAVAGPPMNLMTGYKGFFTLLPVLKGDRLDGYVLISFRYDELMRTLFDNNSFGYTVSDVTSDKPTVLYSSSMDISDENTFESKINVGGRQWKVELTRKVEERALGYLLPAAILATGILMAGAAYGYSTNMITKRLSRKK